jgi:hypothetical protein
MGALGKKLRSASGRLGHKSILHWCPGCDGVHGIQIAAPDGPTWAFNDDWDKPTFSPSVRLFDKKRDAAGNVLMNEEVTLCHYFITDGKILFCVDSRHSLAGQTVELPDWPYAPGTYGEVDE